VTRKPDESQPSRRHLLTVALLSALGVAVLLSPVILLVLIAIGMGGNSTFGGLGAAAQSNTEWWARPLAIGAFVVYLLVAAGAGWLAIGLSRRRAARRSSQPRKGTGP
jgi:hypothetical protein